MLVARLQAAELSVASCGVAGCGSLTSLCLGMDPEISLMAGPIPYARISKRRWESLVQEWHAELRSVAARFYPVGFYGFVVD